jgi:speckle-type POZ protein
MNNTTSVHVGTPPPDFNEWSSTKVYYHGFADLSAVRNVPVDSPEFIASGNPWRLKLYPGGRNHSETGYVAIYLANRSNKSINIGCGFIIKDGKGKQVVKNQTLTPITLASVGSQGSSRGFTNFAKRSTIIDSLVDGTLVVEVHIKPHEPIKAALPQFIPENPFCNNMLQIFNDEESSDIVFAVGDHQPKNNAAKVAKIAPVIFYAHCLIVRACSTILADLCQSKGDPTTPIQITDVSPEVFRHLLHYIYGGKIPDVNMKSHAKEIIDAADRYGVATLKLEAEASLVKGTTFSLENVKELLLYAESKNCALLKEVAMDFLINKKDEVIGKISFNDAPGNLMNDLFAAMAREPNRAGATASGENEFNTLRISELRRMAHEKGLNVDGSREMLIAALKQTP